MVMLEKCCSSGVVVLTKTSVTVLPLAVVNRLAGVVVKASVSEAEGPGFESRLRRDFSGSSHTSDLKT